ncbi:hypothetical protein FJZ18_00360 [Candidatus Pacearchaeota archaeon]|nr:hypothetical protein [Candidatus Pacearchaeota archaeon]
MVKDIVFVVFGGTGDLMRRKLAPAISKLSEKNLIGKDSILIGVSRKKLSNEEYKEYINSGASGLNSLKVIYESGDASKADGLDNLMERLKNFKDKEKIFYLATSFKLFPSILGRLKKEGFDDNSKIVFEKPFGNDLKSSDLLNDDIKAYFPEEKTFRIDHYLAKETVLNLTTLKFSNPVIHDLMNNNYVDKIEIIAHEDLGVKDRIEYYNDSGAIKDMIQSHLLQILALLLAEKQGNIHEEKRNILSDINIMDSPLNIIGQYKSYADELRAKEIPHSKTETFAQIALECKNSTWGGVPLIVSTGKKLKSKYGQIKISFKSEKGIPSNMLIVDIYPKQDIAMILNSRMPGSDMFKPVRLEFCRECEFGPNSPDEYSVLLNEIIKGENLLFPKYEEVRESWRIVEDIESLRKGMNLVIYDDGSNLADIISRD